jgi:hypothetical protein
MGVAQALSLRFERRMPCLRADFARRARTLQGGRAARTRLAKLPRGAGPICADIRDEGPRPPRFFDGRRSDPHH